MEKIISYKQLTQLIKEIVDNHPIIQDVFFTREANINDGYDKFPLLVINPNLVSLPISSDNYYKTQELRLDFKIYDMIDDENVREVDIFSDTLRCLTDVISILSEHPDLTSRQVYLNSNILVLPIYEQLNSNCDGWEATVTFKMFNPICYGKTPQKEIISLK